MQNCDVNPSDNLIKVFNYADEVIGAGDLAVSVMYMGTEIYETTWDLCTKTKCPSSHQ